MSEYDRYDIVDNLQLDYMPRRDRSYDATANLADFPQLFGYAITKDSITTLFSLNRNLYCHVKDSLNVSA